MSFHMLTVTSNAFHLKYSRYGFLGYILLPTINLVKICTCFENNRMGVMLHSPERVSAPFDQAPRSVA
jgi:hypothetical protein